MRLKCQCKTHSAKNDKVESTSSLSYAKSDIGYIPDGVLVKRKRRCSKCRGYYFTHELQAPPREKTTRSESSPS